MTVKAGCGIMLDRAIAGRLVVLRQNPIATAPGSVFVRRMDLNPDARKGTANRALSTAFW